MSNLFSLFPQDQQNRVNQVEGNLVNQIEPDPGFFKGLGSSIRPDRVLGSIERGLLGGSEAGSMLIGGLVSLADKDLGDLWFEKTTTEFKKARELFKTNPRTHGTASQIITGLLETLPSAAGGPATFALSSGVPAATELVDKGVDPTTAFGVGAVTAISGATAVKLLPSYGSTLVQKLITGGGLNVGIGGGTELANHEILGNAGYHDMAEQYKWDDGERRLVDLVIGSAIGAVLPGGKIGAEPPPDVSPPVRGADIVQDKVVQSTPDIAATPEITQNKVLQPTLSRLDVKRLNFEKKDLEYKLGIINKKDYRQEGSDKATALFNEFVASKANKRIPARKLADTKKSLFARVDEFAEDARLRESETVVDSLARANSLLDADNAVRLQNRTLINQDHFDAALVLNEAHQIENTAPGVPTSAAVRNEYLDSFYENEAALLDGELPSRPMPEAGFIEREKPVIDEGIFKEEPFAYPVNEAELRVLRQPKPKAANAVPESATIEVRDADGNTSKVQAKKVIGHFENKISAYKAFIDCLRET